MGVPTVYRRSSKPNVTYDFTDIANNTGIETYYLSNSYLISGGALLTAQPFLDSATNPSAVQTVSGAFSSTQEFNFDVPFNVARSIKGEFWFYLNHAILGGTSQGTTFMDINVYQLNNNTETFLFSGMTATRNKGAGDISFTEIVRIPVTTRKSINANSSLRFNVIMNNTETSGTGSNHVLYSDPANSTSTQVNRIRVPFTLDL